MVIKSNSEILYMNYMKFFGIVYLLIWHSAIEGLNIFVISFFLQMFFFISGYFYKDTYSEKPFVFLRKRIISLYIPYITFCSLFLVLNNIFVNYNLVNDSLYITHENVIFSCLRIVLMMSGLQMAGAMWFVSSLFVASILFCCISALFRKKIPFGHYLKENESVRFLFIVVLYLLGNYLSFVQVTLPIYLDISLVLLFFYYLGYLFKIYEEKIPFNIFLALSSLLTLLICTKFGYPQFGQRRYVDPSFILLCGTAGIYLNIYIAKKCAAYKRIEFVNYAGRNTIVILALHFLAFKIVSLMLIYSQNLSINLLSSFPTIKSANQYYRWLYVISGLSIPLAVKYLFDKSYYKLKSLFSNQQNKLL